MDANDDVGWIQALSRREKQRLNKEKKAELTVKESGKASLSSKPFSKPENEMQRLQRRRLPPLPRDDVKIVMKPRKGLSLKDYSTIEITKAIAEACEQGEKYLHKFVVRPRLGSNILIMSTPDTEAANALRKISRINIRGTSHEVVTYVAFSEEEVKGVVHGFPQDTTPSELMNGLRIRTHNTKIIQARMLGKSKTALITFEGNTVPKVVYFYGGEMPCYLYRPTRQVCYICMTPGHRSDVCPTPAVKKCPNCAVENPEDCHPCQPRCVLCNEQHPTGSKECPLKLRKARIPQGNQNQRKSRRDDTKDRKQQRRRWFSTEWPDLDEQKEGRDRSQSRVTSQHKSPSTSKKKEDTKTVKPKDSRGAETKKPPKVSWSTVAASLANTNTKVDTHKSEQDRIIEELKAQIDKQNAEIADLKKQLRQLPRQIVRENHQSQSKNRMPFPQTQPPPIPQPSVPEGLLNDPSGIGLFLAQMLEVMNNRFDILQRQVDANKIRNTDGKRKLEMPGHPRKEKQQILEKDESDSDFSFSDEE